MKLNTGYNILEINYISDTILLYSLGVTDGHSNTGTGGTAGFD